jgi:hypothetical protein
VPDDPRQDSGRSAERDVSERVLRGRERSGGQLQPHGFPVRPAERRKRVQRVDGESQQRTEFGVAKHHAQRRAQSQPEPQRSGTERGHGDGPAAGPYQGEETGNADRGRRKLTTNDKSAFCDVFFDRNKRQFTEKDREMCKNFRRYATNKTRLPVPSVLLISFYRVKYVQEFGSLI